MIAKGVRYAAYHGSASDKEIADAFLRRYGYPPPVIRRWKRWAYVPLEAEPNEKEVRDERGKELL